MTTRSFHGLLLCTTPETSQRTMSLPESITSTERSASIARKTNETDIKVAIALDHAPDQLQVIDISTGIGFLDHVGCHFGAGWIGFDDVSQMFHALAKHGGGLYTVWCSSLAYRRTQACHWQLPARATCT